MPAPRSAITSCTESTTYADSAFANVSNIDALVLNGANTVTLGANADTTGFTSLFGGTGNSVYTQGAAFDNALTFVGGSGNDDLTVTTAAQLANDDIEGTSGQDTLRLTESTTYADSAFANVSNIDALVLSGANTVTLGANADTTGFTRDRMSTRLNSSHVSESRMPSSA